MSTATAPKSPFRFHPKLWIGAAMLLGCFAYMVGSLLNLRAIHLKGAEIVYPSPRIVALQTIIAPIEIIGAAGIIYFALP